MTGLKKDTVDGYIKWAVEKYQFLNSRPTLSSNILHPNT